jgi:cytochrome P450
VLGGQYIWKIRALHERFGPIVRINPDVVHILDPEYIDEIFTGQGRRRDVLRPGSYFPSGNQSVFMTKDHDLHRMRRNALQPFFSMAKVRELQPVIEVVVKNLLKRMEEFKSSSTPLPASIAFLALTTGKFTMLLGVTLDIL